MKLRLAFKKHPRPRGLAGIGAGFFIDIKVNAKKCGLISGGHSYARSKLTVQLSVKKESGWDWVFLNTKGLTSEEEGKEFVTKIIEDFIKNNEMHYFEKELK